MQPRYYDTAGQIDYTAIKAYAGELRREAIDGFWAELMAKAEIMFVKLRRSVGARVNALAVAHR